MNIFFFSSNSKYNKSIFARKIALVNVALRLVGVGTDVGWCCRCWQAIADSHTPASGRNDNKSQTQIRDEMRWSMWYVKIRDPNPNPKILTAMYLKVTKFNECWKVQNSRLQYVLIFIDSAGSLSVFEVGIDFGIFSVFSKSVRFLVSVFQNIAISVRFFGVMYF